MHSRVAVCGCGCRCQLQMHTSPVSVPWRVGYELVCRCWATEGACARAPTAERRDHLPRAAGLTEHGAPGLCDFAVVGARHVLRAPQGLCSLAFGENFLWAWG